MATHAYRSFRRGAFAATAIAGLSVGSLFPAQAFAQTAPTQAAYQGTAACAKTAKNDPTLTKAAQCEVRELDHRIAATKQRGVEADRRAAAADRRSAKADRRGAEADRRGAEADRRAVEADLVSDCTSYLMAGVKDGRFTKTAALAAAKGKLTAANACEVARGFGYGQKAELSQPSVR